MRDEGNLAINDLVLVVDEITPRGRWLLSRVIKIFPRHDLCVRIAKITTLVRQISKLVLLEEAV